MSMAHFNQAVTLGFLITGHITILQLVYYFTAQIVGALLGSLFVKYIIGNEANLGANAPNYAFQLPEVFGIEVLASALLMAIILVVVYTKGLGGFGGLAIGGIVGLDILFLAFISGASMNPFIRTSFGVWGSPEFMAILECHFHRNIYNRIIGKKEVFHHKTNPNKLQ
jgi:glycerol uptake facilitator-like aquaporin